MSSSYRWLTWTPMAGAAVCRKRSAAEAQGGGVGEFAIGTSMVAYGRGPHQYAVATRWGAAACRRQGKTGANRPVGGQAS